MKTKKNMVITTIVWSLLGISLGVFTAWSINSSPNIDCWWLYIVLPLLFWVFSGVQWFLLYMGG